MRRRGAPREKFIADIRLLQDVYQASGGVSDIRCYEDMSLEKIEAIMNATGTGKVWLSEDR